MLNHSFMIKNEDLLILAQNLTKFYNKQQFDNLDGFQQDIKKLSIDFAQQTAEICPNSLIIYQSALRQLSVRQKNYLKQLYSHSNLDSQNKNQIAKHMEGSQLKYQQSCDIIYQKLAKIERYYNLNEVSKLYERIIKRDQNHEFREQIQESKLENEKLERKGIILQHELRAIIEDNDRLKDKDQKHIEYLTKMHQRAIQYQLDDKNNLNVQLQELIDKVLVANHNKVKNNLDLQLVYKIIPRTIQNLKQRLEDTQIQLNYKSQLSKEKTQYIEHVPTPSRPSTPPGEDLEYLMSINNKIEKNLLTIEEREKQLYQKRQIILNRIDSLGVEKIQAEKQIQDLESNIQNKNVYKEAAVIESTIVFQNNKITSLQQQLNNSSFSFEVKQMNKRKSMTPIIKQRINQLKSEFW
ncbi:Hypothetical_protein [Hexamita inflata]|uniref:Hypothetical_protein n=1 Tax=Hexamita inflata TaxID=28002 RepID=A0AA86Q8I4_9EUKA|nr:Hypothetical protein HINF_LOCUS41886 [Hexamita inflata]